MHGRGLLFLLEAKKNEPTNERANELAPWFFAAFVPGPGAWDELFGAVTRQSSKLRYLGENDLSLMHVSMPLLSSHLSSPLGQIQGSFVDWPGWSRHLLCTGLGEV